MSTTLTPIITSAGLDAAFNAQHNGLDASIKEIALGDTGWTPDDSATGLKSEKRRIPILGGEQINSKQIHLTAVENGTAQEYWVREVGFYLADGTLLAIWSDANRKLAYKSSEVDLLLSFDLLLSALPINSITIDGTGSFSMPPASESRRGTVRIATEAEVAAGTAGDLAVSPAHVSNLKNQIGLQNDGGIIKDLNGVPLNSLVQYKIYKDTSTNAQEVTEASTPFDISIAIDFTPKYADSLLIVRASGNFRVIRGSVGACGMRIELYDGNTLLNGKFGFLYSGYSNNIHNNPNMLHIDDRGGTTTRHYKLSLLRHTTGNSLSYFPSYGQGSISVEEYYNV